MRTIAEQLQSRTLAEETGNGFVVIYRAYNDPLKTDEDTCRFCSVAEFLSNPANQVGTWLIDGGWGGPPGPIHVRWNAHKGVWENGGFGGHLFPDRCSYCGGNDGDMPCAYPGENKPGCLRTQRLQYMFKESANG